ncbi:hypothetical protein E2542_SST14274 [Spatholobus suberectus]|nr:hypothetical protein E2542_SST14274 [Spatholobus suberectus]
MIKPYPHNVLHLDLYICVLHQRYLHSCYLNSNSSLKALPMYMYSDSASLRKCLS